MSEYLLDEVKQNELRDKILLLKTDEDIIKYYDEIICILKNINSNVDYDNEFTIIRNAQEYDEIIKFFDELEYNIKSIKSLINSDGNSIALPPKGIGKLKEIKKYIKIIKDNLWILYLNLVIDNYNYKKTQNVSYKESIMAFLVVIITGISYIKLK